MKYVWLTFLALFMLMGTCMAGENQVYVRAFPIDGGDPDLYSQAYGPDDAGVTMVALGSGVSLIAIISNQESNSEGAYTVEPGIWRFAGGEAFGQTGWHTGTASDSAVTIEYRYGLSNRQRTVAQWEAMGESGTTLIGNWLISGTSQPIEFYPQYARYIGIFAAPSGAVSAFLVPRETYVVWQ